MLALVALGEFFGMTLWFSATAAAPAIASELSMRDTGVAWLTMAVQGGFVVGTLVSALSNVADLVNSRRLFAIGCAAGACANAAIPFAGSVGAVIVLRALTGASLAFVYPPGLKIAAGWFVERRGTALAIVVGALTVGSAFPHLMTWAAADVPWRTLMWMSSVFAIAGGAIVLFVVRDGPHVSASAPFDPHAVGQVIRNRAVRYATLGYLGHMWELYAMWAWIPAFAAASVAAAGGTAGRTGSIVAFASIASGAVGCVLAGLWADTWGKARIARAAMLASGACSIGAGLFFGAPLALLLVFAMWWGFSIVADSAQFSALVSEHAPRTQVGTALTLQICVGFLLTMISMRIVPIVAAGIGWRWAFLVLAPGPFLGAIAMQKLMRPRDYETANGTGIRKRVSAGSDV
jgi:MFS family permease